MSSGEEPHLSQSELAKLSALADGTLDPGQRASVEAWVAAHPRRQKLYETERSVVERLREARAATPAPARLRERLAAGRAARPKVAGLGWRPGYAAALGGALAALALALALTLPGGTPSVAQAAALALKGPAQPAPAPKSGNPRGRLNSDVEDVYFPNWGGSFGWRAVGQRVDRLGQRPATTVYYARGASQLAYTIVGAGPLPQPSGTVTARGGYQLRVLTSAGRTIVTWRRHGHTCVLSASGVPARVLEQLAAWDPATVTA